MLIATLSPALLDEALAFSCSLGQRAATLSLQGNAGTSSSSGRPHPAHISQNEALIPARSEEYCCLLAFLGPELVAFCCALYLNQESSVKRNTKIESYCISTAPEIANLWLKGKKIMMLALPAPRGMQGGKLTLTSACLMGPCRTPYQLQRSKMQGIAVVALKNMGRNRKRDLGSFQKV